MTLTGNLDGPHAVFLGHLFIQKTWKGRKTVIVLIALKKLEQYQHCIIPFYSLKPYPIDKFTIPLMRLEFFAVTAILVGSCPGGNYMAMESTCLFQVCGGVQ